MGYFKFKNNETPANDTNLNAMQQGLMELVFPVGSTYVTQSNTNPSTILGFGTWERLKGKVLVGLDENDTNFNSIGKTGGEKTHSLTQAELPNLNLGNLGVSWSGGNSGNVAQSSSQSQYSQNPWKGEVKIELGGSGQAHNNLQPYRVVGYMWIRTA